MKIEDKKMNDIRKKVEERLEKKYHFTIDEDKKVFNIDDNETVSIVCIPLNADDPFFVVEYGNGEDGDRFYPSDYQNIDALIDDIMKEIQREIYGSDFDEK